MLFTNLDGTTPDKHLGELLLWGLTRRWRAPAPFTTPARPNDGSPLAAPGAHLTWIGHASFVLRLGGARMAIDPVWTRRIGLSRRNAKPGVEIEHVPALDAVLVTHAHYDHLDLKAVRRLAGGAICVVPKGLGRHLAQAGAREVVELDWFESREVGRARVTLVPAHHWSMRTPLDRNRAHWGGYVIEGEEGVAYHAGDTAYHVEVFDAIRQRFPRLDWAMLPIGAYAPPWFMQPQHMNPEEAVRAWEALGAGNLVAMHWGTFPLSDEPLGEPAERLRRAWEAAGHAAEKLWVMDVGETRGLAVNGPRRNDRQPQS